MRAAASQEATDVGEISNLLPQLGVFSLKLSVYYISLAQNQHTIKYICVGKVPICLLYPGKALRIALKQEASWANRNVHGWLQCSA